MSWSPSLLFVDSSAADSSSGKQAQPDPRLEAAGAASAPAPYRRARAQSEESKQKKQLRRPLTALAGRALLNLTALCPLRLLHAIARVAGALSSLLPTRETKITRVNVALCFPELTPSERAKFVRASLQETACMAAELGHIWMRPIEEVLARVVEVRGYELVQQALERGRGVVIAGPHLGAWELLGLWMGARHPATTLYREPRVREMEAVYWRARSRAGGHLFPADASGVRALYSALGRGEIAGILPDQDPGRGAGVFVPFFGIATNTSTLFTRIASRNRSTVLLAFAERLPRSAGYRIHIVKGAEEISAGDPEAGARALNRDVESLVRIAPLQYLWSYKRFRIRPPGSPELYGKTSRRTAGAAP